jgi:hypothetical protein
MVRHVTPLPRAPPPSTRPLQVVSSSVLVPAVAPPPGSLFCPRREWMLLACRRPERPPQRRASLAGRPRIPLPRLPIAARASALPPPPEAPGRSRESPPWVGHVTYRATPSSPPGYHVLPGPCPQIFDPEPDGGLDRAPAPFPTGLLRPSRHPPPSPPHPSPPPSFAPRWTAALAGRLKD